MLRFTNYYKLSKWKSQWVVPNLDNAIIEKTLQLISSRYGKNIFISRISNFVTQPMSFTNTAVADTTRKATPSISNFSAPNADISAPSGTSNSECFTMFYKSFTMFTSISWCFASGWSQSLYTIIHITCYIIK